MSVDPETRDCWSELLNKNNAVIVSGIEKIFSEQRETIGNTFKEEMRVRMDEIEERTKTKAEKLMTETLANAF